MNKYLWVLLGLVLVVLGLCGLWYFRDDVLSFIKGVIGIIVLMIGAIILVIGVSELRE
ncbi:MAG: hypothetical protein PHS47_01370 [Methanocellales archaeon]|nr:hypothetical protein [Methanocellales archaeon]MDD3420934.1 hypothetical protein [Methanocellales archaeon]MDD4898242.1 hypothetical protein [Methanocellales archaeon]MDD5447312.1 hypothetical protein [Methanocellales archaeon]